MNFDITKVKNYKEVCLATQREATSFFSPPLLECNGEFICPGLKIEFQFEVKTEKKSKN